MAKNKEKFEAVGTTVIGSSYTLCEMSLDKFQMYNWLKSNGFKCAKSYIDKDAFLEDVKQIYKELSNTEILSSTPPSILTHVINDFRALETIMLEAGFDENFWKGIELH